MSEGVEKSASGGVGIARTDAAREWRHARAAGRVVLALIAAAVLLATWAMSPGLYTRTVEAEVDHARDGTHEYWSGARLAWSDGDLSADERRGGAILEASITGANARIGVPRWVVWIELTQYGRGTVGARGRLVDRVAGHEISRREIGQVVTHVGSHEDLVLGLRFVACGMMLLVITAVLKVVKHVGHVGTGGTPVPRVQEGPSGTAGPPKAARAEEAGTGGTPVPRDEEGPSGTAGPPEAARAEEAGTGGTPVPRAKEGPSGTAGPPETARAEEVGTGATHVPRDEEGPSGTAGPPETARAEEVGTGATHVPRAKEGPSGTAGPPKAARAEEAGTGATHVPRDEEGPSGTAGPPETARWARLVGMAPIGVIVLWTLASPTMMCPDSVDYVANAMRLMDTGSFAHFDGWRSPGYSILLLGLLAFGKHVATAAGVLNGLMVIATMVLSAKACWLIVREATGSTKRAAWAASAVMWVIGLDPWVLLWTRHVMPECASMLVVAVVVRVLVGMAGCAKGPAGTAGPPKALGALRTIAIGAALGLFIGGACYLRGNFQLLVACVPVCVGVCVLLRGGFGRAVVVGGACAACAVGTLLPWVVRTHARTGEWSFTTGGQFAKALFAQETGLMDWNQSEAFEFDHMLRLAAMRDAGTLGAYPFVHEMNTGKLAAMGDASLPQLVNTDRRARVMVEESLARRPAMRDVLALKAMSTQIGVWAFDVPGYRENAYWAGALRGSGGSGSGGGDAKGPTGGDNQWAEPASQTHLPAELVARVHARTTRSIEAYRAGAVARVFDGWWSVGSVVRMVVAWAGVIGVGGVVLKLARAVLFSTQRDDARASDGARDAAWVRGAVCVVLIAGLVAAHGAAIAWVVMTGLDRYAVAMIPASAVGAVSAWGLLMSWRGGAGSVTRCRIGV